jgi:hypothetical protein
MRRFVKLSLACLAAATSACSSPDLVVPTENLPYAGVRFINAVPDSAGAFGLDFRFVDLLESNAHFRIAFRNGPGTTAATSMLSAQIQYKGAREGNRHFRIFLDDTIQAIASTVVRDSTVALVREHNYTAMLWGNGRSTNTVPAGQPGGDKMALAFWDEDVTPPAAGKIKLRVINATANTIDAWAFLSGTTAPTLASTPTWDNIAPYSKSNYVEVDTASESAACLAGTAPSGCNYTFQVRNDGAAAVLFANTATLAGARPTCSGNPCLTGQFADIEAVPGSRVVGSAVSGIVFPRSTVGSRTPQTTAFTVPAITYMWDKRPPRTCDPYC